MDSRVFKYIPSKKYSISYGYLWIFLGISMILLQLLAFLLEYNLAIVLNTVIPVYDHDFIMLVLWLILSSFWIVQGIIIYFIFKRALNFHNQYYVERNHKKSSTTFCRCCGQTISNEIFKQSKKEVIRPMSFWIKGYFCKKCFKKYFKFQLLFLIIFCLSIFFFIVPMYVIYFEKIEFIDLAIFNFILLLFPIFTMSWGFYGIKKYMNYNP